ncbi:MAG: methylenetetrahydrofolate reductase [NAD(P)H] [Sphingomonadales bacterium]|nr:methylenetetrahydrofolate reductase [NAD(P)H] [Sphingomonadales bacterium]
MSAIDQARGWRPSIFAEAAEDVAVSFEFFPPKTEKMEETLWASIKSLEPLAPRFVSVTYGAGGSTRERTHATVRRILDETGLTPAAHLTCVGAARGEIDEIIDGYWQAGVRHIVALRGDMPEPGTAYAAHPEGYANAAELVAGIRAVADFDVTVAAYPECHPDSANLAADLDNLKRKVDAGASRAITQFFFEPDLYFRFLEHVRSFGIDVPVVPGILPVTNVGQLMRFAKMCGATVPGWLAELFEGLDDRPSTRQLVAASVAGEMCRRLYAGGAREFHFYTLNRADLTFAICHMLGHRAAAAEPAAVAATS